MAYTKHVQLRALVLQSGAAASNPTYSDRQGYNDGKAGVLVQITTGAVVGGGTVTVTVEAYDDAKAGWITLLASAALGASTSATLQVDPRVATAANAALQRIAPRRLRLNASVAGGAGASVVWGATATYG